MQPLELLMMEHRLITKAVTATQAFRDEINAGASIRPRRYWKIVDFWSTYVDIVHHGKEEQQLFPMIMKQSVSSDFEVTIDKLVEEHTYLLGYISDLRRFARPMFTGDHAARTRVIECLDNYVELIIPHIRLEDEELFPVITNVLTKQDRIGLAKEFKAMDARTGPKVHSYYGKLVDNFMKE